MENANFKVRNFELTGIFPTLRTPQHENSIACLL